MSDWRWRQRIFIQWLLKDCAPGIWEKRSLFHCKYERVYWWKCGSSTQVLCHTVVGPTHTSSPLPNLYVLCSSWKICSWTIRPGGTHQSRWGLLFFINFLVFVRSFIYVCLFHFSSWTICCIQQRLADISWIQWPCWWVQSPLTSYQLYFLYLCGWVRNYKKGPQTSQLPSSAYKG